MLEMFDLYGMWEEWLDQDEVINYSSIQVDGVDGARMECVIVSQL